MCLRHSFSTHNPDSKGCPTYYLLARITADFQKLRIDINNHVIREAQDNDTYGTVIKNHGNIVLFSRSIYGTRDERNVKTG